jgi:hypothetical protein
MSEFYISLPPELSDRLKENCRDCWFARYSLSIAIQLDLDPADEADRINKECVQGWRGEGSPQEGLINSTDGPALAMSGAIDENCSNPLASSQV